MDERHLTAPPADDEKHWLAPEPHPFDAFADEGPTRDRRVRRRRLVALVVVSVLSVGAAAVVDQADRVTKLVRKTLVQALGDETRRENQLRDWYRSALPQLASPPSSPSSSSSPASDDRPGKENGAAPGPATKPVPQRPRCTAAATATGAAPSSPQPSAGSGGDRVNSGAVEVGAMHPVDSAPDGDPPRNRRRKAPTEPPGARPVGPGARRAIVVLVNFADDLRCPFTREAARRAVFGEEESATGFLRHQSAGLMSLTGALDPRGDVVGWITLDHPGSQLCSSDTWTAKAEQAVGDLGVDLANYEHVMLVVPSGGCDWAGRGDTPGRTTWYQGDALRPREMAHELGHNFGLWHANAYRCRQGGIRRSLAPADACQAIEYGDPFDAMGDSLHNYSALTRRAVNLLPANAVMQLNESATVTIGALELNGPGPRLVSVRRGGACGGQDHFYLESRVGDGPSGYGDPVTGGVLIRIADQQAAGTAGPGGSLLIDAHPATDTFDDAALTAGGEIVDPVSGTRIRVERMTPTGAVVTVSLDPARTDGCPTAAVDGAPVQDKPSKRRSAKGNPT